MAFVHAQRFTSQSQCISQSIFFLLPPPRLTAAPGERGGKRKGGGGGSEVNRGTRSGEGKRGEKLASLRFP